MKTEMEIIEQLQAQAQAKAKEEQYKLTAQQIDQWKKEQQALHAPPPHQMQHHPEVQQVYSLSIIHKHSN